MEWVYFARNGWAYMDGYQAYAWVKNDGVYVIKNGRGRGAFSRPEPIPEGLTLDEAKAYVIAMWRMQG